MKAVQYFSDEYLEYCKTMSPQQILEFIENFRALHFGVQRLPSKSKLISIKVPENLLEVFKLKAKGESIPYQTKIKELMKEWVQFTR